MTVIKRVKRIIKTNLNEFLDQFESSEEALRSREAELAASIGQVRSGAAECAVEVAKLQEEEHRLTLAQREADAAAREAVSRGDDAAAREAIERKFDAEEALEETGLALARQRDIYHARKERLVRQRKRLNEVRGKLVELEAIRRAAEELKHAAPERDPEADVEAEIREEVERRGGGVIDVEEEDPVRRDRERKISAQLDALKRSMNPNPNPGV